MSTTTRNPAPALRATTRSAVAFRFHPVGAEVKHKVTWNTIGAGAFEIPPGHGRWRVGSSRVFEKDTVLLSLHPHMHFRGESMKYTRTTPMRRGGAARRAGVRLQLADELHLP